MMKMISISLIVPVYNEESRLEESFLEVKEYLSGLQGASEVILVNDGSTDRTGEIVDAIARRNAGVCSIHNPRNRGKGYAVRRGILSSRGRHILFMDADLAVPVHYIGNCLKALQAENDIVIGSRHLARSRFIVRQGFTRQFLGEVFRRFARLALWLRVSDITCGLKGFQREAAFEIFKRSRIDRWGYDAEILFLAARLGYRVLEIPVEWRHRDRSKVSVARDSVRTAAEIVTIGWNFLRKRYGETGIRREDVSSGEQNHGR
jgi:dolichyl-phosphate beta-glucosyltransferase